MSGGSRDNTGKERFDLISPVALFDLARVLEFGSRKYGDRNWEKGFSMMDCFAAIMRHAWKWLLGETYDEESGLHHMSHVMCNCMFIVHLSKTHPECDDRVFNGGRLVRDLDYYVRKSRGFMDPDSPANPGAIQFGQQLPPGGVY